MTLVAAPYFQTNIENTKKDNAFRTIQGAMAWMDSQPDVTGTIYYIPTDDSDLAFVAIRYEDGVITEQWEA